MKTILNAKNVEDIVFKDNQLKSKLTKHSHIFANWHLAYSHPSLRYIKGESVYNLLKSLDSNDLSIIKDHTGFDIELDQNIYKRIVNINSSLDNLEFNLPLDFNYVDFCIYRKKNEVNVTLWK